MEPTNQPTDVSAETETVEESIEQPVEPETETVEESIEQPVEPEQADDLVEPEQLPPEINDEAEAERLEAERLELERLEALRLEAEQAEAARLAELDRLVKLRDKLEAERLEAERLEKERVDQIQVDEQPVERDRVDDSIDQPVELEQPIEQTEPEAVPSYDGPGYVFGDQPTQQSKPTEPPPPGEYAWGN